MPQNRIRLIVTAGLGAPVELTSPGLPHQAFGPIIDWSAGDWYDVDEKPAGVIGRVERARARGLGDRFLIHYSTGNRGRCLSRPIGTITTKLHWAAVDGERIRMLTKDEYRQAMTFPEGYVLPKGKCKAVKMLGNAVPPAFAQELCRQVAASVNEA